MKSIVLIMPALVLASLLIVSEAAAQKCTEGASVPCVVGGKKGTRSCDNGRLSACIPDVDEDAPLCGTKVCAGSKVCQDRQCVSTCKEGFTDCGGACLNLSHDSGNCGACGHVCQSGTNCQPSAGSGVCGCTPPSIGCGDICRNPTNDPSNCGACGNVCTAPNTSCRNSQCVPPEAPPTPGTAGSTGDLKLDLFWKTTDPNGLPFNPDWRARSHTAFVEGNHVDLTKACPACAPFPDDPTNFEDETCWRHCTTFPTTSDGGLFCTAGHINWLPAATYSGALEFQDYSARGFFSGIFADDDYTFTLTPTDEAGKASGAGFVSRDTLKGEMAFLETVSRFQSPFWKHFGDLVDQVPGDDLSGPKALFAGRYAIVIGLLGLDVQHDGHSELHPIYAMALRRTENPVLQTVDPRRDCWAIFARNWGNEGFCSNHDHPLDVDHITFHLPAPVGATAVTEISRDFKSSGTTAVSEVGLVEDGAEITMFLGRPEDRTQVNGEVCLRWAAPPGAQPPRVAVAVSRPAGPRLEQDEFPGSDLLTPAQVAELRRSLPATPSRDKRLDVLAPKRVPFVRVKAQVPATVVRERVGRVDAQKVARQRQIQSRICQLLRGHPQRPKICESPLE